MLTGGVIKGDYSSISQHSPNRLALSYGCGSYLRIPFTGTLQGGFGLEGEKKVRIHIQLAHEYRECGNQVSTKSLPLQRMRTQQLQSPFVGEVANASYQPCT